MAVALDLHVLADRHGARRGDPPEVVAAEVDEHHVLGPLLGVALELLGEEVVLARRRAARARAGDRMGRELVALDLEQELGRAPTTSNCGRPDEEQVRARVDAPQRPVQADAVERSGRSSGSGGRSNDWRRASTTWIASPAAIASLATSTAWMYSSRPRLVSIGPASGWRRRWSGVVGTGELGGTGAGRPLERLEDGRLGDPVAALEVRRVGVERGDGRQRVGQVVEDQHEVGLDERGGRDADRIALRQRDGRLEGRHRVVGDGTDRTAGEARHPVARLDAPTPHEVADGVERVVAIGRLDRQVRAVRGDRDGARLDTRLAVAHLEQPPRPDTRGTSSGPGARRPRPTRGGRRDCRHRGAGRRRWGSRGRPAVWRAAGPCRRWR